MIKSFLFPIIIITIISSGCTRKNDTDKTIAKESTQTIYLHKSPAINEVLFVGMSGNKSVLYKYEFATKSYAEYWKNYKEEVVELLYSPDKKSAFMLTASQYGKKGVFPFVDSVKLYLVNSDSGRVKFLENIGSGLQVFATWINNDEFQVYLHSMDVSVAKYVEQKIEIFNASGKKLSDEKKKYYLEKEGYPQFPSAVKPIISPDNKFSLLSVDSAQIKIYLVENTNNKQTLITVQNQKLNAIVWSVDGKFLVFNTIDISPGNETLYDPEPNTSKLFIYSLSDGKIIKMFDGGGFKNFLLNGDYLMFDDGFKQNSKIFIYNLHSDRVTDSIKVADGCGLKSIPAIPDYEA